MKLKDKYDPIVKAGKNNPYADMGRMLIENIDLYGLGVQPKSDLEALLFHCICDAIENQYYGKIQDLDYDLMQMLRISPAKLRSLRITRSAKFLNNLDWHDEKNQLRIVNALKNAPVGAGDIYIGKISIVISDPHVQNLIERMVEENRGVLDKTFSSRVLVLDSKQFLYIVAAICGDAPNSNYAKTIKAIQDEVHEIHDKLTKDNIFDKFKDAFQERAFDKLIELGVTVAKNVVKNKLGI